MSQYTSIHCGLELNNVPDLNSAVDYATISNKFDFIVVPLAHPRYERDLTGKIDRQEPFTRSDLLLSGPQWSSTVIGKTSNWLELDSLNESVRVNSVKVKKQRKILLIIHIINVLNVILTSICTILRSIMLSGT